MSLSKKYFNWKLGKSQFAFTLAEILIVIGIVGIVAEMTIPTLITNFQNAAYATSLKKVYSQMNQVLMLLATDQGTIGNISTVFGSDLTATGDAISSYYKVINNCKTIAGETCFKSFDDNYDGSANATTEWSGAVRGSYKFITADGVSFGITSYQDNCTSNRGIAAAPSSPPYNNVCGKVYVDVNGAKEPNNWGRDVFHFYMTNNRTPLLYPSGGFYHSSGGGGSLTDGGNRYWNYQGTNKCSPTSKYGEHCAGRVIEKNWVVDY